jgi:hypothetical protein
LNIKLLKILDIIENKIYKDIESIKSNSHRSPAKGEESRGVGRHHHHPTRHSTTRTYSSLIIYPIINHKKTSKVNELQEEIKKIKPPTFDSEHKKDEDEKTWLLSMRRYFQLHNYSS